jgi:carboxylesterase type B
LNGVARHRINTKLIEDHWDDMLRLAGSLKLGTVQAAAVMKTLRIDDRPTKLAQAVAELGRIDKTIHALTFVADENNVQREMLNSFPNLGVAVDGYVFPKKPAAVFAKGQQHRVDLLLGNNAREGGPAESPSDLAGAISSMYGPLAEQAKKLYVGAPDPSYGTAADQWGTDTTFRCNTVQQLIWHAAAGNTAYEFEFARVPPGRESVGATHASELAHVFGKSKIRTRLAYGHKLRFLGGQWLGGNLRIS